MKEAFFVVVMLVFLSACEHQEDTCMFNKVLHRSKRLYSYSDIMSSPGEGFDANIYVLEKSNMDTIIRSVEDTVGPICDDFSLTCNPWNLTPTKRSDAEILDIITAYQNGSEKLELLMRKIDASLLSPGSWYCYCHNGSGIDVDEVELYIVDTVNSEVVVVSNSI